MSAYKLTTALLTPRGDLICDNSLTYTVAESGRITF